jgi:uncharacterized protein
MFLLSNDYWEIKKTEHKGRGVFAKKDIPAGVVIGDYLGKLVHDNEEEKHNENHNGLYTLYYTEDVSIIPDADDPGVHLINHSCEPNTFMYSYKTHTLYFALRHIFKGEELTVSYLLPPIDDDCKPCEDVCKCGSELCTGTMHLSEKVYDDWNAFDDEMIKNDTFPPFKPGDMLPILASYPENIEDNNIFPLFGSFHHKVLEVKDTKLPSQKELRERLRQTGQQLHFTKLNLLVLGISNNHLIGKVT